MMPRKKKKTIIIVSIIIIILMIAISFVLLYINTDMFKSNQTLFAKYMGQNLDNLEVVYKQIGTNQYEEVLKQNKCVTGLRVKINFAENIGTSSENTRNSINQLKLAFNGQTDYQNQYNEQNIQILNNDEKVAQIEYIQDGNTYGIKLPDAEEKYIVVENSNLKELFKKLGFTEEQVANIPDKIEANNELSSILEFSEQEKQEMQNKYTNMIIQNISKEHFTKQKNQEIQINGKKLIANSHSLTITKEQLNHIYLKFLEEVKKDEIILKRIDKMQEILERYQLSDTQETSFRKQFEQDIDEYIAQINKNNIGNDETKIVIYEVNGTTVSSRIQTSNYEIYMDILAQTEENYLQIGYKDHTTGKEQEHILTYQKTLQKTSIILNQKKEGKTVQYSIESDEKAEGNLYTKNTVTKYQDEKNRVEIISDKEIGLVNGFEKQTVFDNENSIHLNRAEAEQATEAIQKAGQSITGKLNELFTTTVKWEDLAEVLKVTGLVKEENILQAMGVTQTERNRFNSKFEMLQGENLENTEVLKIIEAIKQNLNDMEVTSNTELKLKLDKINHNEELVTTISSFIEQNKNKKYNVKIEYEETTGLVNYIVLTMLER